jgi:hypothetical protein
VGVKNKQYCILNKQYSKEEYFALREKIVQHMNEMPYVSRIKNKELGIKEIVYRHGEFFPPELSPFAYNETSAQEFFPLTKEDAIGRGYVWRDDEARNYTMTIPADDLPQRSTDAGGNILNAVVGCSHKRECDCLCSGAFKIIPMELAFYQSQQLPLPHLCPNCRHRERIKRRNPLTFRQGPCRCAGKKSENGAYENLAPHQHGEQPCQESFITAYPLGNKTIVYCEACYQAEVA